MSRSFSETAASFSRCLTTVAFTKNRAAISSSLNPFSRRVWKARNWSRGCRATRWTFSASESSSASPPVVYVIITPRRLATFRRKLPFLRCGGAARPAGSVERPAIGGAQLQVRGLQVLLQVSERGRAGDRQHHGRSRQQPGDRYLGRRRLMARGDLGDRAANARRVAPGRQREPRQEGDAIALAGRKHGFGGSIRHVIAVLHRHDGRHSARYGKLADVDIGDADVADLPLALELDERAYGIIERHARVGTVQLVEINPVGAQALEARLAGGAQMRWPAVPTPLARPRPRQAALGRNDQPVAIGRQRFGDQLLADPGTVGIGCVDEADAELDRTAQQAYRCCPILRRTPDAAPGDPHAAEAEPADAEIAKAQRAGRRLVAANRG